MRVRSVVGAVLVVLTSHLLFRQAVTECASRPSNDVTAEQNLGHAAGHHETEGNSHGQHSRAPVSFQCCLALASCGATVALAAISSMPGVFFAHLTTPLAAVLLPASRVAAPDPPPPRA